MQAFSLQSSLSSPRLLHQSSAPSSGLATPQPLERNHSTGLQLQRSGVDTDQVCSHAAYALALATHSTHGSVALPKQWMLRRVRLSLHTQASAKPEARSLPTHPGQDPKDARIVCAGLTQVTAH